MQSCEAKKRIMFQKDKDACFLIYNILIILDYFKCYSRETAFNDYKKISYLIDFVSSDILTSIFAKDIPLSIKERQQIQESYIKCSSRQNKLFLVIQSLRQKKIINVLFDEKTPLKNSVYLIKQDLITPIIDKDIFKYEYQNIDKINKVKFIKGIKKIKLPTLLQKLYENKGVKIWEI